MVRFITQTTIKRAEAGQRSRLPEYGIGGRTGYALLIIFLFLDIDQTLRIQFLGAREFLFFR